jgi:YHS domain-containing protein
MTSARQKRKPYGVAAAAIIVLALGVCANIGARAAGAITERVVVDWHTGLAIAGYDPVAYYTDGKPLTGRPEFELRYAGAVWRFCNSGNRAAFAAQPEIYMPQFGGYDPLGVAHGVAVAGNPNVWLITGERLFLFYDQARRQAFAVDGARIFATAERKWPELVQTLSP